MVRKRVKIINHGLKHLKIITLLMKIMIQENNYK